MATSRKIMRPWYHEHAKTSSRKPFTILAHIESLVVVPDDRFESDLKDVSISPTRILIKVPVSAAAFTVLLKLHCRVRLLASTSTAVNTNRCNSSCRDIAGRFVKRSNT